MTRGLKKISANTQLMEQELESHPQLLAEAYQSFFRFKGVPGAYEILKERTRGKEVAIEDLYSVLDEISVLTEEDKVAIRNLTVKQYLGYAQELANSVTD
jgi:adenylosuccinate lyase